MKKEYLIFAMVVLLVWVSRNNIPQRFQFWKTTDTMITVQNNSGQDLADVTLVVCSELHPPGSNRPPLNVPTTRRRPTVVSWRSGLEIARGSRSARSAES